jgi:hypothetical protein
MVPATTPPEGLPAPRRGPSKATRIGLGLLFTLVGLFLLSVLLPTAPGAFSRLLPIAAAGIATLWVGGILMGIGSRS